VQAGSKVSTLAELSVPLARPGSRLDLTGDEVALAEGSPATRRMNGRPIAEDLVLGNGSMVLVVRLVHAGAPGQLEIYKGAASGKQAAAFVVSAPPDREVQRSATVKPGEKLAALTFDDGPGKYT
jgi:hypothetical protein